MKECKNHSLFCMGFKGMTDRQRGQHRGWERWDQGGLHPGRPCQERQLVWLSVG